MSDPKMEPSADSDGEASALVIDLPPAAITPKTPKEQQNGGGSGDMGEPSPAPKKRGRKPIDRSAAAAAAAVASANAANQDQDDASSPAKQRRRRQKQVRDQNAPSRPLNGYVMFLNANREVLRAANPDMSFTEITKRLAEKWRSEMSEDEKREYNEKADRDKERYEREHEEYRKTDSFKMFTQEKARLKSSRDSGQVHSNGPRAGPSNAVSSANQHSGRDTPHSSNSGPPKGRKPKPDIISTLLKPYDPSAPVYDIPIFTEEFLNHNAAREAELRTHRRANTDLEEQNGVLAKHISSLRAQCEMLDAEVAAAQATERSLETYLDSVRAQLVAQFTAHSLTDIGHQYQQQPPPLTKDNVDDFVQRLFERVMFDKSPPPTGSGPGPSAGNATKDLSERIHKALAGVKWDSIPC